MTQTVIAFPVTRHHKSLTSRMTDDEQAVYLALSHGRENARQIPELSKATGIPGRRVQALVESLILDHQVPVGTSMARPFGNYIISDAEDLRRTVQLLRDRGISNLVRAAALLGMELDVYLGTVQTELRLERRSA